jgi:hypothetical protein
MDEVFKEKGEVSRVGQRLFDIVEEEKKDVIAEAADPYSDFVRDKAFDLRTGSSVDELWNRAEEAGVPSDVIEDLVSDSENPKSVLADLIVGEEDNAIQNTINQLRDTEGGSQFEDFFGSLTLTEIGGGHMESYYRDNTLQQISEMWADYISLRGAPDSATKRYALSKIEEFAPKSKGELDSILEEMADGSF